jgi:hypothetical protein
VIRKIDVSLIHKKMKSLFIGKALGIAVMCSVLCFSAPLFGAQPEINQALDLVHQAWGPSADTPPTNDQRTTLLKQALDLLKNCPDHHVKGHRVAAIKDIETALDLLKNGDPDGKAVESIHDADSQLRDAASIAD